MGLRKYEWDMHVSLAVGRVCAFCKGVPFSHFVTLFFFCNTLRTGEMGLQSRLFIEVKNEIPLDEKVRSRRCGVPVLRCGAVDPGSKWRPRRTGNADAKGWPTIRKRRRHPAWFKQVWMKAPLCLPLNRTQLLLSIHRLTP